ncbi:SDR family oxidoreductase [Humibacter sp. RRB41]|uniref:SDR family oxidoreductase n=1 Tax=Humibacter sp. RRB41 TaxID=2919946 RepID=UPI001FAA5FDA|nr:SDR family oxidoreductase [Humibacter sp. RRB41]
MTVSRPLRDLMSLDGRTAVVTGGAGPLGSVLSSTLAELGARVVVIDLDEGASQATADALDEVLVGPHLGIGANLMEAGVASRIVDEVERVAGGLDIIVNNAAFTGTSGVPGYAVPFDEQTDEAFLSAAQLNLLAPFSLVRTALPLLRASTHGSVVNVSSIYGLVGPNMRLYDGTSMGNPAAYGATKGGIAQLTRYLATVMAPGVRVNAIAPGGIARGQDEQFVQRYEALTPLGRMATEDDMRGAVAWLASDAAGYVTGQVIAIDGGWTAW